MSILRPTSLLLATAVAALTFACTATSSADKGDEQGNAESTGTVDGTPGSMVGGHNMTLFGSSDKLYLSHIPMYENPHGKQVIVEVTVASGVPADAIKTFNTNNFTVKPSRAMSLYDFAAGTIHSVSGTIYFGNLESGGRPVYSNVTFDVKKVVFQKTLSAATPASSSLDYIALGTPDNAYLVHVIDKAPSFDQVVSVKIPAGSILDAAALDKGTIVTVNGAVNGISTRLSSNAASPLTFSVPGPVPAPPPHATNETDDTGNLGGSPTPSPLPGTSGNTFTVVKELGCLPGPDFYGSCPAAH